MTTVGGFVVITDVAEAAKQLAVLMAGKKTLVVTGAGTSTDSGLPDYRGTGSTAEPSIDYDMFVTDPVWQRWVWQRNHETWRTMEKMQPSGAHRALAAMEKAGLLIGNATQNVDGLDARAGAEKLWELHGSFRSVDCVDCGVRLGREEYDELLEELNPNWPVYDETPVVLATANREAAEASEFKVAPCPRCGGMVKPSVVFFGEPLPASQMDGAMSAASQADVILVAGTSLVVSTGMWVMRQGWAQGAPVAIINRGPTAGDSVADVRIEAGVSEVLREVVKVLGTIM